MGILYPRLPLCTSIDSHSWTPPQPRPPLTLSSLIFHLVSAPLQMAAQPVRPLIDRRRTSSRDRGALHSYSNHSSPVNSPVGSPTNPGEMHLRSALKHGHVHPEPREGIDLDQTAANPQAPCSPPAAKTGVTTTSELPSSGLQQGNQSNGTLPQYSRRVGFDTFDSGADLEEKGGSTGGGTGASSISWDRADYTADELMHDRRQLLVHDWRQIVLLHSHEGYSDLSRRHRSERCAVSLLY